MLGVGQKLPDFKVTGVKPGFNAHEENGQSAFEKVTQGSFPGQWKVLSEGLHLRLSDRDRRVRPP
jgi:hypothetical protein